MADATVENKTLNKNGGSASTSTTYIGQGAGKNVLHDYRLVNYVFTLSVLRRAEANTPDLFKSSAEQFVILKSGGKGNSAITQNITPVKREYTPKPDVSSTSTNGTVTAKKTTSVSTSTKWEDYSGSALVAGFNKNSPGRFDMFMDNVEIETLMAADEKTGMTQPTTFTFDVFEPYSINGFIEALHVASIAAGYPTYTNAVFLLKMDFFGYPDSGDFTDPTIVPKSTRYFPIQLTGVEVNIDEKGTKYQVKAIASNERAFGNPSQLKKPVKISGTTVQDILKSLTDNVTSQVKESEKQAKKNVGANDFDEYRIIFPKWVEGTGWSDGISAVNEIASSKVSELLRDNTVYKFPDPGTKATPSPDQNKKPETYKLEPTNPVVQFPEGKNINECITAIIRDSHYVRTLIEKMSSESESKKIINDNMIDYFIVRVEVTNKDSTDTDKKRPYQIFTYVVQPYKVLYTRIPGFGSQQVDMQKLAKMSLREYNYIYTGNNLDILNFKLNFNTLFFEALPNAIGNPNAPPSRDAAARTNKADIKTNPENLQTTNDRKLPAAPAQSSPDLTNTNPSTGGQPQKDPYYAMAKAMHSAITDSKGSMLQGEMEILGDPFYLVTGGIGNQPTKPSKESNRETIDGEASFNYGEVLITINFLNPIDIEPLERGGGMFFDPELVPFSGIYRVNSCKSHFKDGAFKQNLMVIRQPGQAYPKRVPSSQGNDTPSNPSDRFAQLPNSRDTLVTDITPATPDAPGQRPTDLNLWSQLNRGLPSPGLPGVLSNFTAATGGLGGTVGVSAVSGATTNFAGASRLATQIYGGVIPGGQNQPAFGMPMPARAAVGLQQRVLSPAGLIQQLGNKLADNFGVSGGARQLLNQVLWQAGNKLNRVGVLGSGIGAGARVQIVQNNTNPVTNADYRNQQLPLQSPTAIPTNGIATGLDTNTLAAVARMPDTGAGVTNNVVGNAQSITQGTPADPNAIASAFGLNPSQVSGLSPNLQSKLAGQLEGISAATPPNTNLSSAAAQGINLNGLDMKGISNLPATPPYTTAPDPAPDKGFLDKIAGTGGASALARAFGVNSINSVPQSQLPPDVAQEAVSSSPSVTQNYLSKLGINNSTDALVLGAKLYAERKQLGGVTGIPGSLEGNFIGVRNQLGPVNVVGNLGSSVVSKFGSKTAGTSPLDKIMIR